MTHPQPLPPTTSQSLQPAPEPYVFDLDGGRACLDFVNTRSSTTDHLSTYADVVAFAAQSQLITPQDAEWLRAQSVVEPATAAGVVVRAKRLREALRDIFTRLAAGQQLPEAELGVLNVNLAASLSHARVVPAPTDEGGGYRWGWSGRNLDAPLWPITRSAADLLTSDEDRRLVRECGADDCAWLFIDNTRNRSRQWCSMTSCGNREKARRHYQRVRDRRDASGVTTAGADAPRAPQTARRKRAAASGDASATAE